MTHIPLTDADLAEIEALVEDGSNVACMCVTSYHAPRLIAEVRALRLSLAEETAKQILTIESFGRYLPTDCEGEDGWDDTESHIVWW